MKSQDLYLKYEINEAIARLGTEMFQVIPKGELSKKDFLKCDDSSHLAPDLTI